MVVYIQYHRLTFSKFNNSKFMCRGGVVAYSRGTGKRQLPGRVRNCLRKCPTRIFLFKYLKMRFMSCRLGTLSYTIQDLKLFLSARASQTLSKEYFYNSLRIVHNAGEQRNSPCKCPTRILLLKYSKMRIMSCRIGTLCYYTVQD